MHCASIQQPTGGPKDSIPPVIVQELPANLSKNFKAREITITFNEFIKLKDQNKEISISPDVERTPIYKVKKRDLVISLPDSLEENTTYTINFGKAIGDYNEGNPILNYSYVFATGDQLDSLNVSGQVVNALTQEKEKEVSVILIPTRQDSIFGKKKATIFALTDTSGNFKIKNLKEDDYRIYALKEKSADRIFNSPDDEIGFLPQSFHLNKDTSNIHLTVSKPIQKTFRIVDRKIEKNGAITFLFSRPVKNPLLHIIFPEDLDEHKIVNYANDKDSATMWIANMTFDSLKVSVIENGKALDTTLLRRGRNEKYDRELIITDNLNSPKVNRVNHIQLTSSAPIKAAVKNNIVLTEDSTVRTNFQLYPDTSNNRRYILRYNWRPKRNYVLELKDSAFVGNFGEKSKTVSRKFTLDEVENFGDIHLNIKVPDSIKNQYLVQITNEKKETLIRSTPIDSSQIVTYKQLPGGKYLIRIVYDTNKNKQWDPADVDEKILPEKVWYYNKIIVIRPNWEQEEPLEIPKKEN